MAIRSMFAELDHPGDDFRSHPNAPESTAAQCLAGAQESLNLAVYQRRLVYEAFAKWIDTHPTALGQSKEMLKALEEQRRKRKDYQQPELETFDDYMVLRGDRIRAESEVAHWRELIDWWRARDAQNLPKTYGASRSMRDLVKSLADGKSAP